MGADLTRQLARANELLETVRHTVLATVNEDGSPLGSPVFAAFDDELNFFWASGLAARHSRNIMRAHQVFAVLFDSTGAGGGLYIQAVAAQVQGEDFAHAHRTFNAGRERLLREHVPADHFVGDSPQRLWQARPERLWVNASEKDAAGHVIRDQRYEIKLGDLLGRA